MLVKLDCPYSVLCGCLYVLVPQNVSIGIQLQLDSYTRLSCMSSFGMLCWLSCIVMAVGMLVSAFL